MAAFAKRLRNLGFSPSSLVKGRDHHGVIASAALCRAAVAEKKFRTAVQKLKSPDNSVDLQSHFALLTDVDAGLQSLQSLISGMEAEAVRPKDALQNLLLKISEEKNEYMSKLMVALRRPLTLAHDKVKSAFTALDAKNFIDKTMAEDEASWRAKLLPFARGSSTKDVIAALHEYDDRYRVAHHSVGTQQGGIKALFSSSKDWVDEEELVHGARKTLAVLSLVQTMYNNSSDNRAANVTAALGRVPKTGKWAINPKLAAAANVLAS